MTGALSGARVVNTRAIHQAAELDALLAERGAIPLSYPCLAITPPANTDQLDATVRTLFDGQFDWLVLTSTNAVNAIADRLAALALCEGWLAGSNPHSLLTPEGEGLGMRAVQPRFKIAAVGDATATAITSRLGLTATFVSIDRHGKALARELPISVGDRVLMPISEIARPEPAAILRARGAVVTSVVAYRTGTGTGGVDLPELLQRSAVNAITFTSPSAIAGCLARLVSEGGAAETLSNVTIVTIGPTTDRAAKSCGMTEAVMAPSPSLRDLVETLEATLSNKRIEGGEAWLSRSSA